MTEAERIAQESTMALWQSYCDQKETIANQAAEIERLKEASDFDHSEYKRLRDAQAAEIEGWKADQKENLRNQCDLHAEIERLRLAEEGAKEAFGHIVQMKQDAEQSVSKMEQTIQAQQEVIVSLRTQLAKAQAEIERLREALLGFYNNSNDVDWPNGLHDAARSALENKHD